ncbi:MAG: nucleotidyltransferase family protein [Thermodesulfobacteriota bacterium]
MARKKPTAGIILAAGMSARFGSPKQLTMLGEKPLIERVLDVCLDSLLESIYLVLGYRRREIVQALGNKAAHSRLKIIVNRDYRRGQSTSLKAGIAEIRGTYPSTMFILGDQPFMDTPTLNRMLERYWASDKDICVPFFKEKRGNPTIFSSMFYDEISNIRRDVGARKIIQDNPGQVLAIEVKRASFFLDIDTQADLEKASSHYLP